MGVDFCPSASLLRTESRHSSGHRSQRATLRKPKQSVPDPSDACCAVVLDPAALGSASHTAADCLLGQAIKITEASASCPASRRNGPPPGRRHAVEDHRARAGTATARLIPKHKASSLRFRNVIKTLGLTHQEAAGRWVGAGDKTTCCETSEPNRMNRPRWTNRPCDGLEQLPR